MSTRELALELEIEGSILLGEVKDAIRDILIVQSTTEANAKGRMVALGDDREERLDKSNRCIARLEFWLERVLLHGIKSPPVKGSFWQVIEKLPDSLPGTEKLVKQVSSLSKHSIARGRIFIRTSLNESSIQPHLSALMWNQDVMFQFYEENALMRNEEQCSTLLMLLEPLNTIQFKLTFKEKDLDKPSYWEKYITPELLSIVKQRKYARPTAEPAPPQADTKPKVEDKKKTRRRTIVLPEEHTNDLNTATSETSPVNIPQPSSTVTSPIQSLTDTALSDTDNGSLRAIARSGSEASELDEVDDLVNRIMTTKQPASSPTPLQPPVELTHTNNNNNHDHIQHDNFSSSVPITQSYIAKNDNFSNQDYPSFLEESKQPQKSNDIDNTLFNDFVFVAELPPPIEEQENIISNIYKFQAEQAAAERSVQHFYGKDGAPPKGFLNNFQIIEDYEPSVSSSDFRSDSESVLGFDMDFPAKSTLYNQNYQCAGCKSQLSMRFWKHKYCYYTGMYYCRNCQRDDKSVIPVRLVRKLDRKEYPVCVAAKAHIVNNQSKPLIHVNMINPLLYEWDSNLATIKRLRVQMLYIGEFILTCRNNAKLLALIGSREQLLHNVHIYSLLDLVDPKALLDFLCNVMEKYIVHITQQCETCKGKGHYCELCKKDQVLFAFQFKLIVKCRKCRAIFHKSCVKERQKEKAFQCPKCQRLEHYNSKHHDL